MIATVVMNCEFAGHSAYKDYVSTVTDPINDPITNGLSDYIVTDELYHPHVFDRDRSTIFLTAFDCEK
jgi:type 1 glutamine amidotransferase